VPPEHVASPARSPASKAPLPSQSTHPASTPLPAQVTVWVNGTPRSTLTVAAGASVSSSPGPNAPVGLVSSPVAAALNTVPSGSTEGPSRSAGCVVSASVLAANSALLPVAGTPPENEYGAACSASP
jgi:hypothetical protein